MNRRVLITAGLMGLLWAPARAARPLRMGDARSLGGKPRTVRLYEVYEFTVQVRPTRLKLKNPYVDLELTLDITPAAPAGKDDAEGPAPTRVRGFYYGRNQYRARYLALKQGRFNCTARIARPGEAESGMTFKSSFTVAGKTRTACRGPASVSKTNPIWFQADDGKPLFFIGAWSHSSLDANMISGTGGGKWSDTSDANFNRYVDLAVRNGYILKDGAPTKKYFAAINLWLDDLARNRINWIVVTADHMAWGFQTASNWKGLRAGTFDDPLCYDPNAGLIWDYALVAAMRRGIYVKMNMQEFCQGNYGQHPFQHIPGVDLTSQREHPDDMVTNPAARDAWRRWVTYLVSRYGAFANVMFQMGNEPPGDGCHLGSRKWGEFDTFTKETVKSAAVYDVLYSSGAPVGGGVHQGDFNTYHPTATTYSAANFYSPTAGRPHHNEEIKAYNGGDLTVWRNGSRYVKFASFVAGGHGSALVMWGAKGMFDEYKKSSVSLHNFVKPVLGDLFGLEVNDEFIVEAPAEFCKGLASDKHFMLYMQKGQGAPKGGSAPVGDKLVLKIPDGDAYVHWFDPAAGRYARPKKVTVADGALSLDPPAFSDDCALRVSLVRPAKRDKR